MSAADPDPITPDPLTPAAPPAGDGQPDGGRRPVRASAATALGHGDVLAAVSVGGGVGAAARYALTLAWPTPAGAFPWTILTVNAVGCGLIGILMVVLTEAGAVHRLVRPFLGTGVLGGFTTFSTYTVDAHRLITTGRPGLALGYLALTLVTALTAVWAAAGATRLFLRVRRRR
ncbi:fluoride efflux transporter FluC [Goodfellowiella coeruleoviolacea]|uniref:Fluoride-specific ion channel FluC n=1 Tax=Goodfellowiella coeruleoviolacea TaxID=334858 RepID=A0AAE3KMH3_9PSEU|nr:CrcB family protein [Goodfellowiella coeruleoviolacea]MCP2167603.1 CrcB protein [Goodfellowiella coeruleoviolacea]